MLKNIKLLYIIKTIFSYIDEERKLKIIKYNKNFQNKINIRLLNYQCFKGNYIKYASTGIGKEYNGIRDTLIFKGRYLHGERSGDGIEYNGFYGELTFKGRYLHGKINGWGKEHGFDDKILYKAEYLNGKRNGKRKEYYK